MSLAAYMPTVRLESELNLKSPRRESFQGIALTLK